MWKQYGMNALKLKKIERKINIKLKFQNVFPGESGFLTSRGILNEKEIQALYAAYKISKIVNKNQSILEIGGFYFTF